LKNKLKTGKLTKSNINNHGYDKYLKMKGEVNIEIDGFKPNLVVCHKGISNSSPLRKMTLLRINYKGSHFKIEELLLRYG